MSYDSNKLKPYLEQKNDATNKELYSLCNATTDGQKGSIRKLKSRILKAIEKGETTETPKQKTIKEAQAHIPPRIEKDYIDDPNELLLSVAIRELNRVNPDPRWASILINCKREKITTTNEVIDQFKQLPTQVLVNLLSKSLQEE